MVELNLLILQVHPHLKLEEAQYNLLNLVFLEVVVLVLQAVILVLLVVYTLAAVVELELLENLEVFREQIDQVRVVQEKI